MAMEVAQHNWKKVVLETTVEAEETVEEALIGRRARRTANDDEEEANKDNPNNSICFDDIGEIENLAANIRTVNGVVNVDETGNANVELLCGLSLPPSGKSQRNAKGELICGLSRPPSYYSPGQDSQTSPSVRKPSENDRIVEEVEEEVVELEFFDTAVVDKLHTHNAYCPNCSSRITKVVLRRVKQERRIVIEADDRGDQTSELVGCLSCFSVFVRIGKNLNPFPLFGSGDTNSVPSRSGTEGGKPVANEGHDWRIPMEDAEASSSKVNPRYTKRPVFPVEVTSQLQA